MIPKDNKFFMPAEWHLHQGTFISWPNRRHLWINNNPNGLDNAQIAYANVANAIAEFEPVYMVVDSKNVKQVKKLCSSTIKILEMSHDDSWIRDNGPTFVINNNGKIDYLLTLPYSYFPLMKKPIENKDPICAPTYMSERELNEFTRVFKFTENYLKRYRESKGGLSFKYDLENKSDIQSLYIYHHGPL